MTASTLPRLEPPSPRLRVVYARPPATDERPRTWQPALPLQWELPGGLPAEPPPARHLRLIATAPALASPPLPGPAHPGPWIARLAPAILEVIAGERPAAQLTRWTTREILATLARRGAAAQRHPAGRGRRPQCRRIRAVRLHAVAPGIVEAAAVVSGADRCRALALRLEVVGVDAERGGTGSRWLVTACEIG